ncbi:MAG: hypothetical protein SX243_03515 [Acidobacteriota bacterium]|nr:hypothetical protein [Acidobacteriota bacterium]
MDHPAHSSEPETEPDTQAGTETTSSRPADPEVRWQGPLERLGRRLVPTPELARWAGWGLAVTATVCGALIGIDLGTGGSFGDHLAGLLVGALAGWLLARLGQLTLYLVLALPRWFSLLGLGAVTPLAVIVSLLPLTLQQRILLLVAVALVEGSLAAALGYLLHTRGRPFDRRRISAAVVVVLTLAANLALVAWLRWPGSGDHLAAAPPAQGTAHQGPAPQVPDPSRPGDREVRTLTYGSGLDTRRPELGPEATLLTPTVDATPFARLPKGWRGRVREAIWGFDLAHVPLAGRVWYPTGDTKAPLVLMVHGNHFMLDLSDPGYAYLGELLASRGFIAVSIDQNFLNGSWLGNLDEENDARGWLLLEHLRQWRRFHREPGNPFHGRVDLENVALVGHSRGGEAVAVAAAFNRLPFYPDDATVAFDYGFSIRSLVAIAPVDGQYRPAGHPVPLRDLSLLVLHGGHDADVSSFAGLRFFHRLELGTGGEDRFKAAALAYRANHGQFNSVWGADDVGWPSNLLLDRRSLLAPEEQRQIARLYISAFLEDTLHGDRRYRQLFRDHRWAGEWLPRDHFLTRYQDASFRPLATFEEDLDVTTGSVNGVRLAGSGLAVWREEDQGFRRRGNRRDHGVVLGWRRSEEGSPAAFELRLGPGHPLTGQLATDSRWVFSIAALDEEPPKDSPEASPDTADEEQQEPLDLTLEWEDASGALRRLALSEIRPLSPVLPVKVTKLPDEMHAYGADHHTMLQTYEVPLQQLLGADLSAQNLAALRWVFDRSPSGVVLLDDIGFAGLSSGESGAGVEPPQPGGNAGGGSPESSSESSSTGVAVTSQTSGDDRS